MHVTLAYVDDCPNWRSLEDDLRAIATELDGVTVDRCRVTTIERAERLRFRGSPGILIDGVDLFPDENAPVGLTCRLYETEGARPGRPTAAQLRLALLRPLPPPTR
ncbi:MAG: thioredoxin family protein [Acidimicrobiales bacterium]